MKHKCCVKLLNRISEAIEICEAFDESLYEIFVKRNNDKEFLEDVRIFIRQNAHILRSTNAFLQRYVK